MPFKLDHEELDRKLRDQGLTLKFRPPYDSSWIVVKGYEAFGAFTLRQLVELKEKGKLNLKGISELHGKVI